MTNSAATPIDDAPAERLTGLRAVLSLPAAYRLAQNLIGAESFRRALIHDILGVEQGERIIDIGCGTADILEHLPPVDYVGFDHSTDYVDAARKRFGPRGRFIAGTSDSHELAEVGARTLAMAIGVLHHLDDRQVREALALARDKLAPGGRFVSIDPTLTSGQHPIGRFLAKRDRGRHVRSPEETATLVSEIFPTVAVRVRHDLLRVPYSHVISTATVAG